MRLIALLPVGNMYIRLLICGVLDRPFDHLGSQAKLTR